jgi:hypothetical protein
MCEMKQVYLDTCRIMPAHYDAEVGNSIGIIVICCKSWVHYPSLTELERFQVTSLAENIVLTVFVF